MQPDLELFKTFIAGCRLEELHTKTGVPVIGRMGSSKSTTIAIQMGAIKQLGATEDGRPTFNTIKSETFCPQTSDGWMSKTLNVGCYEAADFTYIDTAGLNENRGWNQKLWTTWSTSMMFELLERIPALLVCIDFAEAFSTRAPAVRELAECLRNIVGSGQSSQPLFDSMVFIFSNPWRSGSSRKVTESQVASTLTQVKQAEHAKIVALLEDLERKHSKGAVRSALAATTSSVGLAETHIKVLEGAIDWEKVSEQDAEDYDNSVSTIRLLTTIEEAIGGHRCFLSWPDGATQSQLQRTAVCEMIRRTPGVSKEQLQEVVRSRTTNGLLVCETLAKMTVTPSPALGCSYRDILANKVNVLRELRDQFMDKEHAALLAFIDATWEGAREDLIQKRYGARDTLETEMHTHEKESKALTSSTKVKPLHVEQLRVARRLTLNPLSWFGLNSAKKRWQYNAENFLRYDLVGSNFEKTELRCQPSEGCLELEFESSQGQDLHVDIKIMRYEKDLPSTQQRVDALTRAVQDLRAKLHEVESEIMRLQVAQGKREVVDIVFEKSRSLGESLGTIDAKLGAVDARTSLAECTVVEALARIFSLLQRDTVGLSEDLSDGPRKSIADFMGAHEEVLELTRVLQADNITMGVVSVTLPTMASPIHEDEPPVNCWRYQGRLAVEQVQSFISSFGGVVQMLAPWLVENRLPISGMLLVLSFYVPLSALLRCMAVGIIIKAAVKLPEILGSTVLGGVNRSVKQLRRDLHHHFDEISARAGDVVQEASTRVAEQTSVNVDLRAHGSGPMDMIFGLAGKAMKAAIRIIL